MKELLTLSAVAVRAHSNMAANLVMYADVIGVVYVTGTANQATATAGTVLLTARVIHAAVYFAGIPYLAARYSPWDNLRCWFMFGRLWSTPWSNTAAR